MLQFCRNLKFEKNNLCRFRGLITPSHLEEYKDKLLKRIEQQAGVTTGEIITVTYGVNEDQIDMEILIPCDKEINLVEPFSFEKKRIIENCLRIRYFGYIDSIKNEVDEINQYFAQNCLKATSKAHYIAKDTDQLLKGKSLVDIYIGTEMK
ncbi:MAG: hypothetical protein RSE60_07775 [Erysipelotrichaceae bacterium]